MTPKERSRILDNVTRSMEMEGFRIDSDLRRQGERILSGQERTDDVVARYVREAKELSTKNRSSHER